MSKRENYISWDECFMQMAFLIAQRSKDPNTQAGAVIVDENNIVVRREYPFGVGCEKLPHNIIPDDTNRASAALLKCPLCAIRQEQVYPRVNARPRRRRAR